MKKNIIYIGDSYCASYKPTKLSNNVIPGVVWTADPTHLNLAANELGLRLYPFGYAGRSWFFSRSQLMKTLDYYPDLIDDTEAVVFFHTDSYRYNSTDVAVNTGLAYGHTDGNNAHLIEPYCSWRTHIMDSDFQEWAQLAWFKEINQLFADTKKIHFNVFKETEPNLNYLMGQVYRTPLLLLSLGELEGTDKELLEQISVDQRRNHFNAHNNQALADIVIDAVRNYHPAQLEIDTSKFDLINPNAHKYPNPGFGTC